MSDNDDETDKTDEVAEQLEDGETLGGDADSSDVVYTLDEPDDAEATE
jgi:hypothetical protein